MKNEVVQEDQKTFPVRRRAWPVTIVGLLLIIQGFFLFSLLPSLLVLDFVKRPEAHLNMFFPQEGGLFLPYLEIEDLQGLDLTFSFPSAKISVPGEVATSFVFWVLFLPTSLCGIVFLRIWPPAWCIALILQIVQLSLSLYIYFEYQQPYIYLVMLYSISLIFYLNHYEVLLTFGNRRHANL